MKKILSLACIAVFGLSLSANAAGILDKIDASLDKADKQVTNIINKPVEEKAKLDAKKKAHKEALDKKKAERDAKIKAEKEKLNKLKNTPKDAYEKEKAKLDAKKKAHQEALDKKKAENKAKVKAEKEKLKKINEKQKEKVKAKKNAWEELKKW